MSTDGLDIHSVLFSPFNREVGNPKRQPIWSRDNYDRFIADNNGVNDCFVSTFALPTNGQGWFIDKITLDFDGKPAFDDSQRVFTFITGKGLDIQPIASGVKGIHLHTLLRPHEYLTELDAKTALKAITYGLLEKIFGKLSQGSELDPNTGKLVFYLYADEEDSRKLGIDPKILGDTRRLIRIPGTMRPPENNSYCVSLDPAKFLSYSWLDVVRLCKTEQSIPFRMTKRPYSLVELPKIFSFKPRWEEFKANEQSGLMPPLKPVDAPTSLRALELLLRPCLMRNLMVAEPRHDARVAATIDLLKAFDTHQIATYYSKLNWVDFNYDITVAQIESCKKYNSYSCKRLKALSIPRECCIG